jgi:hypothetical protein
MERIHRGNLNAKPNGLVQRPSNLIKVEGSTRAFKGSILDKGR